MASKLKLTVTLMTRPFIRFLQVEAAGGIILLICTVIALALANSPLASVYADFWKTPLALRFGTAELSLSLAYWINDALMTVFFFVVGLEIKREMVAGELADRRAAMLPILAALGGMVVPALFFTLALGGQDGAAGWGIPMATDIAFVVGFLSLFGKRVPHGLKIFLLSLAIVDDLGAIIVIAVVYSSNISIGALAAGFAGLGLVTVLNRLGVRRVPAYVVIGTGIWGAFLASGVHPTIAGVLMGLLTPASAWIGDRAFLDVVADLPKRWREAISGDGHGKNSEVRQLIDTARETVSPLERLEVALHPWVAFMIMPVFALANAGVALKMDAVTSPVSIAVAVGLVLGKPVGILLFSWIAVKVFGSSLPERTNWKGMAGAACLAGIGFTMSIFIAGLALDGELLVDGKVGTMVGSAISAVAGLVLLHRFLPRNR